MTHDLIIRGGQIVDGTGSPPRTGDVAIQDGVIVAAGEVSGSARRTIEADSALVTPGFIDVHTHYDGQMLWDDQLDPSFSNGVTTIVAGNCGVGFAPAREEHRKMLIDLMEGVEDIPGAVLTEGLDWGWKSFPDYLERLRARRYAMDVAVQLTHAPLRVFVMGERAANHERATAEDLDSMCAIVREAMAAGAAGFSAARFLGHRSSKGAYVPGTFSDDDELLAIARAMGEGGAGVFQIVPHGAAGDVMGDPASRAEREAEHERFVRIARASGRPLTYQLLQFNSDPGDWRMMLAASARASAEGLRIYPQTAARAAGAVTTLEGYHPFMRRPSYCAVAHLPLGERAARLRRPELRAAILAESDPPPDSGPENTTALVVMGLRKLLPSLFLMSYPLDYEPGQEMTVAAIAGRTSQPQEAVLYDHLTAGAGDQFATTFATNYEGGSLEVARQMLSDPHVLPSLSDAGAHVKYVCDGALPSFQLAFWCRDRTRGPQLPLELMVRKATHDCAALYDLSDRGVIAPGKRADLNVIDFQRLKLGMPQMFYDMPSGGGRLLQRASGYLATIVAGEVTRENDEDTGGRPGRLVRPGSAN
jgi:N-acyl-D-aspartate/D-glutamate deacylase